MEVLKYGHISKHPNRAWKCIVRSTRKYNEPYVNFYVAFWKIKS